MVTVSTAKTPLEAAAAALARRDFQDARKRAEQLLRVQPRHAGALQIAGLACAQSGDPKRGAAYLRKAIAAGANNVDMRFNLARALIDAGELDEADRICNEANAPGFGELAAEIARRRGDVSATLRRWEDVAAQRPDDAAVLNNLGNARHAAGDLDGALDALTRARTLDPTSALIHLNYGRVLVSLDRYEDACVVFEAAHSLAPQDPLPLLELGRTLTSIDHAAAALPALGSAARLDPHNPATFIAIGQAFLDVGDRGKAEQSFQAAIQVAPQEVGGYLNLGLMLEQGNRIDELAALIDRAAARRVAGDPITYLRALLLRRQGHDAEALTLAQQITGGAVDETVLSHMIGQLADRLGDPKTAWHAFQRMNDSAARSPLGMSVDRGAYQRRIDHATAVLTSEWFARWAPFPTDPIGEAPVFLVGFPRSGTTLLDTFLLGHSDVHVLEEVPVLQHVAEAAGDVARLADLTTQDVAELRARYFAELARVAPDAAGKRVVDKNPLSMLRLPLIHRIFPEARIVLALRHPADAVLSCVMQNFKPTEAMSSFLDVDTAGRTYDRAFTSWERARALLPATIHELRYEDMVADPEAVLRPLVTFMGLDWQDKLLDHRRTSAARGFIRTPSYAQVTEPVYARAMGRWQLYADQMRWALPVLQPWIERYGYAAEGGAARSQPVTDSLASGAEGAT